MVVGADNSPSVADVSRRAVLAAGVAAMIMPNVVLAGESAPIDLQWKDLRPHGGSNFANNSQPSSHATLPNRVYSDPRTYMVVKQYNGHRVRLPGFLVPLDTTANGASEFLLVPFVGACIHVPPPPPNQIVFAATKTPYAMKGLFQPVYAVGTLDTVLARTDLAHAAYTLAVDGFEAVEL